MKQCQPPQALHIKLLSDATFSRGEGTAGFVDADIEYDRFGIPFIGGKTIRGLLRDSWLSMAGYFPELCGAAGLVLGRSADTLETSKLRIGDAHFSDSLRNTLQNAVIRKDDPKKALHPETVLSAFTAIRNQTTEDRKTDAPEKTTLRSTRVLLRAFVLKSCLHWFDKDPSPEELRILAMCALGARHGGLARNRGRGHLCITFDGDMEKTRQCAGLARKEASA